MNTQMSDGRGTMYGEDTRIADVLSTSSRSGTALNTESALQIEHHKNNGGGYENTFQRQARRRTATTTIRRLTDEERNLTPEQQKALQEAVARLETY